MCLLWILAVLGVILLDLRCRSIVGVSIREFLARRLGFDDLFAGHNHGRASHDHLLVHQHVVVLMRRLLQTCAAACPCLLTASPLSLVSDEKLVESGLAQGLGQNVGHHEHINKVLKCENRLEGKCKEQLISKRGHETNEQRHG